ncbi:hypothetical protein GCM10009555_016910 [Acrocarpospora macrocephala]|uniref:Uncharacterized protein n=1 Tax=Acrocarpospora macrocephala TaxID=150177 RepID=A0A5M3WJI7_9ACTN|nr:hypothetical protein [Acrocarpospora macrocephala]GES07351.1 hypothetical protein Amac_009460 [Acrocarpospora macrocephala]
MTSNETLSYASVSITPRPPRVIIVVTGGEHWSYWVRRALYRADKVWGGASFAVVPHQGGRVKPVLLRACEAYDPDFVVTYSPTVADVEHFYPGFISIGGGDGQPLEGADRDRLLAMARTDDVPSNEDEAAREQIVGACSSYRSRLAGDGWHEHVMSLDEEPSGHFASVLDMPGTWQASVLACPTGWGGALGAAVASHAGVAASPSRDAEEPELDDDVRTALTSWLLGQPGGVAPNELLWHPGPAFGVDRRTTPTAHERTKTHLVEIVTGLGFRRTGLLVVGDSAEDFALSRLWQLTFGNAYWLPPVLGMDEDTVPWPIGYGVMRIARDLARHSSRLVITSMSRSKGDLELTRDRLLAAFPTIGPGNEDITITAIPNLELSWRQGATVGLAVQDQWDSQVTVPIAVAEDGTRRMAAPLPAPVLVSTELATHSDLEWHTDVQWQPGHTVRRRGLDSQELFADRPAFMHTWARSSRHGMTYQSRRYDVVLAGTRSENTLARAALRDLSLAAWIRAKAAEHNLTASPSDAGRRTSLLAKMLGGRRQYVDLFGGPLLPAIRAMLATSATSDKAYPDNDGVSLSSTEGVLTFAGICARVADLDLADVRDQVDAALRAGVLRRGMVLGCATCEQKQFQTIDKLGQRWPCIRCDALNDLDRHAWKLPADEPTWFYDLYPVGRHVLSAHGEVSALLSAYLMKQRKEQRGTFDDVEEVEFLRGKQPQVEVDLVVYTDDVLTVAECKSPGELTGKKGKREVLKKCRAAAWLRADQLLFATTAEEWTSATRVLVRNAVSSFDEWGPLGPPRVDFVAGLGRRDTQV